MTEAEKKIGYKFRNILLLGEALTHSSYANEKKTVSNERLEFLGDSVLSIIISDYIFRKGRDINEGYLTKYRAILVCEHSLAEISKKISLGSLIKLGRGEEMTGGRKRASIVSDAFEAVLASIYLDGGMEAARAWLLPLMKDAIEETLAGEHYEDYKTMLQELVQKGTTGKVTYRIVAETGLDHDKVFEVEALIDDLPHSRGKGQSKKEAEQHAAKVAYEKIKNGGKL